MAGQKNISIKNNEFLVFEGRQHGFVLPRVSPPVWCALSVFVFLFHASILLAANCKQSDMDSGQLQMHRYLASKDDSREVGCRKVSSRGFLIARMKSHIIYKLMEFLLKYKLCGRGEDPNFVTLQSLFPELEMTKETS